MKALPIFATLLLAFAVSANAKPRHPLPPRVEAAKDVCLKKLDLTEAQIHPSKESGEPGKDRGCYMACVDKELGMIDNDGKLNTEEAIKKLPPFMSQEDRTKAVDTCSQQRGADECESALLYHNCLREMMPRPPIPPELQKAHDGCKEKLSMTDEEIKKSIHSVGEMKKDCFLACVAQAIGFAKEDGKLDVDYFIQKLPPHVDKENAQKVAEECANEEGADECETVVLVGKCLKNKKMFFHDFLGPPPPPHHQ